ncbi:MAG TPA: hypothetical protein VEZ90_13075 [Blastocatellia bacterium]|nr:hypothetical protein [Blastocatellia bacterium]
MTPNWKPLEEKLGAQRCVGFMYMGRINGINLYKHGMVRSYLNLTDAGECFAYREGRFEKAEFAAELAKVEAHLTELGETLESVYDETYIRRKQEALRRAGIPMVRIKVEPEDRSIH